MTKGLMKRLLMGPLKKIHISLEKYDGIEQYVMFSAKTKCFGTTQVQFKLTFSILMAQRCLITNIH